MGKVRNTPQDVRNQNNLQHLCRSVEHLGIRLGKMTRDLHAIQHGPLARRPMEYCPNVQCVQTRELLEDAGRALRSMQLLIDDDPPPAPPKKAGPDPYEAGVADILEAASKWITKLPKSKRTLTAADLAKLMTVCEKKVAFKSRYKSDAFACRVLQQIAAADAFVRILASTRQEMLQSVAE